MRLVALHEARYDHGRTVEKIMSFTDEGRIRPGFELRINDQPIEFIGYYHPDNDPHGMFDDQEDAVPYFIVTPFGKEDPDVINEEDFLPHVEVWEMKRII